MRKVLSAAALAAILTMCLVASAPAALLSGDDLYYNPWDVPFATYTQVETTAGTPYEWSYNNVQSVSVLPLLNSYAGNPSDPGAYPSGYVFSQADYRYQANTDYTVDLTGGAATATFLGPGIYHVRLHLADNTEIIQAVLVDTGFASKDGESATTGPEVEIPGPHADLVVVSKVPATDPEAAEKNEALDIGAQAAAADGENVERAESVDEAVAAIRAASLLAGRPIHVELIAHGMPGSLDIGSDGVGYLDTDLYTTQEFQDLLDGYVDGFSTYSCNYGAGPEGDAALQTLADSLSWASGWMYTVTTHYNEYSHGFDLNMGPGGFSKHESATPSAVELSQVTASQFVPTYIDYHVTPDADVTIRILPSTWDGVPTGPAIKTVTFTGQAEGFHRYIWLGTKDDGSTAPIGHYVATIFAEAGTSTAEKMTTAFQLTATPAPVVVPDSAVWTPDNTIAADNSDSASVTFKVMDVNGWADITSVTLDLRPLGYASNVACALAQDLTDPLNKTVNATLAGIKAKVGARCTTSNGQPSHYLTATCTDTTNGTNTDPEEVELNVTGDPSFDAYVKHRRVATWDIDDASLVAVGGGIPGTTDPRAAGPFTYTSIQTLNGYASLEISAGLFGVTAQKVGFGSEAPISITVPYTGFTQNLYLHPLTIAECRATGNATMVNVEGVCYAQPVGVAPTAAIGLAARTDTLVKRNQWYVCDPNDPANGMLFMVTEASDAFPLQWHDIAGEDMFGNSTYIGKRPAVGETIMITGLLDIPGGHERRVLIQDSEVEAAMGAVPSTIDRIYLNQGNLGGLPATPVAMTIGDIYHPATLPSGFSAAWGKFGQVTGATVVAYQADGVEPGVVMTDPVPYLTIANLAGNKAQIAIDMPTTLNVTTIPAIGSTYTFTGAASRRTRFGSGALRVRSAADMVQTAAPPAAPGSLSVARTGDDGDPVNVHGIVTLKSGASLWIEAADRSIGIRVKSNPAYIAVGEDVQVIGTLGTENGERVITPTSPILPISSGNTIGALDMRSREIGGAASGTCPGVDTARGALNVGLKVHFLGMVTGIGAGNAYYYLWDGANRSDLPVSDGNADGFVGVKVEAAPPAGCAAWTNWVEVTGVVSTMDVGGAIYPTIKPISAAKVTPYDTITATAGTALTDQWNLMSVPAAPALTSDGDEWTSKAYEPYMVVAPLKTPDEIDGRMYRWENCSSGLFIYDLWSEVGSHGPFGGLLLGDGYWLQLDADWPVSYSGKNSALDQWIGICNTGWMIIGQPKDHSTYLADVKVHDGGKVWTMYEAIIDNGWIDCVGYWWDNQNQGLVDVGIPDCWASTDSLVPWHGYWLQAYRGDLALIVPEAPAAP